MSGKYYAVRVGRRPGIYSDWSDVQPLVSGYPGAQHKSFKSRFDAEAYLAAGPAPPRGGGTKRSRTDDYGSDDGDRYAAFRREPPAQGRRSEPLADRRNYPEVVTSGVLIAVSARPAPAPAPPRASSGGGGGGYGQPQRPVNDGHARGSGSSRFDPVVEGPFQPIRPSALYELEFDGASRGNPGQAGCGALLRINGSVVCRLRKYMGSKNTNNEAEYTALIEGIRMARRLGVTRIHAKGDSKLVVMQVSGRWAINKDHLRKLCDEVHEEKRRLVEFTISHIPREWNADADKLSNDAIDLAYH